MATSRTRRGKITRAAADGDEREVLEALRDRIARTLDDPNTPARDLAALSKRLREIIADLREVDKKYGGGMIVDPQEDEAFDGETV